MLLFNSLVDIIFMYTGKKYFIALKKVVVYRKIHLLNLLNIKVLF